MQHLHGNLANSLKDAQATRHSKGKNELYAEDLVLESYIESPLYNQKSQPNLISFMVYHPVHSLFIYSFNKSHFYILSTKMEVLGKLKSCNPDTPKTF